MHGSSDRAIFFWTLVILMCFWLAGAMVSWLTGMLTPKQMRGEAHIARGIPYLSHFGMLNDLPLHVLLAFNASMFLPVWLSMEGRSRFVVTFTAVLGAIGVNLWWGTLTARSGVVEAQARDGRLTAVGWIHVPHTAAIFWLFGMMMVMAYSQVMHPLLVVANASFGVAHLLLGNHWPLKMLNPWWNPLGAATQRDRGNAIAFFVLHLLGLTTLCLWAMP